MLHRITGVVFLVALVTGVISRDDVTEEGWFYRTRSHLTEVPTDIPDNVTRVYLSYNDITTLQSNVFSGFTDLETIDIDHNDINTIQPGAFSGVPTFWLDLQSNKLTEIRADMWDGQNSVLVLILSYNRITTVESAAFRGLTKLGSLTLKNNRIAQLKGDEFQGLGKLTALHLERNGLQNLPDGIFADLEKLELLTLSFNQIEVVPVDVFRGLRNLKNVFLDHNKITALAEGTLAFSKVPELERLSVDGNQLTTFRRNVFTPGNSTDHHTSLTLSLDRNPMQCDTEMCWLKEEYQKSVYIYWNRVDCANYPNQRWAYINLGC